MRRNNSKWNCPKQTYTLASIDVDLLKIFGIQGILLDLDNTIVSEDDCYLSPGAEAWIKQAKLQGLIFFILSNGKWHYRAKAWSQRLKIPLINPARKPFTCAFRRALKFMKLTPKQVVVIGDSCHTDILEAWFIGCYSIQVAILPHPLRWWEKILGKRVQTPYPHTQELWKNDFLYNNLL
ncbi:YqeG family HAD IIIA-type phosphatase [Gloeocapsopsis dulcis]|uniref:HAD family hydrolase n=1 Tax=Gloeocapsopsis dulcis AAB1 = 1H9 TaxID=1433147 RepID=A0A6N8FTY0_9CHRO|nr:YqeG family HAD IIIA-type phosphatase [Gloeocapsopsis dulcis]MUL36568.1 HAD family hydrolase [Gloeocapsopsis dulcis AAB1 = 1H9]WNN87192.1 YqeG family HAD IIIA-type phosphatase [Gloeocapsopsis dulcis]